MEHAQPVLERIGPMLDSVEVVIQKVGPAIEKVGPFIEKAGPVLEKIGPVVERIGPAIDKIVPAVEKAGPVVERIGPVVQQVGLFVDNANRMVAENRPRILQLSEQIVGIAKSGREQVEKIGGFLGDASQRAQTRLEQIDRTVENTVGQVEQVGDVVRRAVMTPVREVNGLAAGISAAVATIVHRPRRPQVDEATQDEELFI
jgi:ABC-type transporter Mla subunit MlaD